EAVRAAEDPAATLLAFLESTYRAAAELCGWDRGARARAIREAGHPRSSRARMRDRRARHSAPDRRRPGGTVMSVAFLRESDEEHKEPRFELPIPPGPSLVTPRGLALIEAKVGELEA